MTVSTLTIEARTLAKTRWDEAGRVRDAYTAQVVKRRGTWRAAPAGKDADKARRMLADAVAQLAKAEEDERAAWRVWHSLGKDGPQ